MLIHMNHRDRPPHRRPRSEPTHQHRRGESASFMVVCGLSLAGLATSLFVLGLPRMAETFPHGFAIAFSAAGIMAAVACAVVVAGGSDE
jgi:anti-sigma factor RsiW